MQPSSTQQRSLFDSASTPARLSFDIELADVIELAPGDDLDRHGPFRIACAATADDTGRVRHWHGVDARGAPGGALNANQARDLLATLRDAQRRGVAVFAWNGLSFDLRWLGHAADDLALAREVALDLHDPMFQFYIQRGFPVSLGAVADGLGIQERKLMSGADAPVQWAAGNTAAVLDYVAGDCRLTDGVVAKIQARGQIAWRTKKGSVSVEPMARLRPVRELLDAPPVDVTWMQDPIPRTKFTGWLSGV